GNDLDAEVFDFVQTHLLSPQARSFLVERLGVLVECLDLLLQMFFERRDLRAREFDGIARLFDADERTDGAAGIRAEVTDRRVDARTSARRVVIGADPERAAGAGDQERAVTARRVVRTETRRLPGTNTVGRQMTCDLRLQRY